jgi:ATP-binding cassette subfamily F protein 3
LVTIVFELKDGRFSRFEGNYSSYLEKKSHNTQMAESDNGEENLLVRKDKSQKREEAEARQKISRQRQILNEQIENLEKEMEQLEAEKTSIEAKLAEPDFYKNQAKAADTGKRYQLLQDEISKLYEAWEKAQNELESLLKNLHK